MDGDADAFEAAEQNVGLEGENVDEDYEYDEFDPVVDRDAAADAAAAVPLANAVMPEVVQAGEMVDEDGQVPAHHLTEAQEYGQGITSVPVKLSHARGPNGQGDKRLKEVKAHLRKHRVAGVITITKQGMRNVPIIVILFVDRDTAEAWVNSETFGGLIARLGLPPTLLFLGRNGRP